MSYTYDWHETPERDFLHWMLPTLLDPELIEQLSEPTRKFTEVTLTIQINGVDVDPKRFIDGIQHNMDHFADEAAKKMIEDIPRLDKLRDEMIEAELALKRQLRQLLSEAGVERWDSYDEDDRW